MVMRTCGHRVMSPASIAKSENLSLLQSLGFFLAFPNEKVSVELFGILYGFHPAAFDGMLRMS